MNIPSFSIYCMVMAVVLLLSGCASPVQPPLPPTAPDAPVIAAVQDDPAPTLAPAPEESQIPPENQKVQALVEAFAALYFAGDREGMQAYLTEDFGAVTDVYPYDPEDVILHACKLPQSVIYEMVSKGKCWASVEFSESAEHDSYTYLSLTLVEELGEWKIESYGLEK